MEADRMIETAIETNVKIWIEGMEKAGYSEPVIRGIITSRTSYHVNKHFEVKN